MSKSGSQKMLSRRYGKPNSNVKMCQCGDLYTFKKASMSLYNGVKYFTYDQCRRCRNKYGKAKAIVTEVDHLKQQLTDREELIREAREFLKGMDQYDDVNEWRLKTKHFERGGGVTK